MKFLRWLYPGIGFKRWLCVFAVGTYFLGLGLAITIDVNAVYRMESFLTRLLSPEQPLETARAGFALAVVGLGLSVWAVQAIVRSIYQATVPRGGDPLGKILLARRSLEHGPKIVVVGGGTGLATLIRGLKEYTDNLTALVTVSDDGGSSGRLRQELGILPPGDIRNCLLAMADTEPLMQKLFQYRFKEGSGLAGHNFGNLFIAALTEVTGDFEEAVRQSSKVLAVRGRVLPTTLDDVVLCAELEDGEHVKGETSIASTINRIKRVYLEPSDAAPTAEALSAIDEADAVILGPGSLYTSVISSLAVSGVAEAVRRSSALKIYVCNVMTQPGETAGYTARDHVDAILQHAGRGAIDIVLISRQPIPSELVARYQAQNAEPVKPDARSIQALGLTVEQDDILSLDKVVRHSPQALARSLMRILLKHRGSAIRNRLMDMYMHLQK